MSKLQPFSVTILGNSSAVPTINHNLTAQVVRHQNSRYLIDCGEGTQLRLIQLHVKQSNLDHILISHLHGDHFFGLFGLISTLHLFGREKPMTLFAPAALEPLLKEVLRVADTTLRFPIDFFALEDFKNTPLINNDQLNVKCFQVLHRIPTWGFKFTEQQKKRKINKEFIQKYRPDIGQIKAIREGEGYKTESDFWLSHDEITLPATKTRSYAYCADTAYFEPIISEISQSNLIYHEATFEQSLENVAIEKYHSTARQAAMIAKKAAVGKLILGHFSARYKDLNQILAEAKEVFPNTFLSEEGVCYEIE